MPLIRRCGVEGADVLLEDGRGEKRFLFDERDGGETSILGIETFFAREKGFLGVREAEMELASSLSALRADMIRIDCTPSRARYVWQTTQMMPLSVLPIEIHRSSELSE